MVIAMSQPWEHPDTGVWYLRSRVPADIRERLAGQKLTLRVAGRDRVVTVRAILKVSLATKDRAEAKVRHAAVQAQLYERWAVVRRSGPALSHEDISRLAAQAYREMVAEHRADPGRPEGWGAAQDQLLAPLHYLDPESDGIESEPYDAAYAARELEKLIDLDQIVGITGLGLDAHTRLALLQAVAIAQLAAARTLENFAAGDYRPDDAAALYERAPAPVVPTKEPPKAHASEGLGGVEVLLTGWEKEKQPKQATRELWRSYVAEFVQFVGHGDPKLVRRPDVNAWKAKMLEDGLSPKTINDSKLAALKAVLGWAVDNDALSENAAARVSVKGKAKPGGRMRDPEPEDATTILQAASQEKSPVYRWVPLLCAATGARVAEICQLRAEDISDVGGISVLHIREAAGSVKNSQSERMVPLHLRFSERAFSTS